MNNPRKFFILGIDGMDPEVFRFLHSRGEMPVLSSLAEKGNFRFLITSNPPQSPVSWTNIATGSDPGKHGIFDFLHRDPATYTPELALFNIKQHRGGVQYISRIQCPSIFERAMRKGIHVTLLRWPLTFPAPDSLPSNSRLLAGMGVPDLLGTLGRYIFYTADHKITENNKHGRIIHITPKNGVAKTELYGPRYTSWKGVREAVVSMTLKQTPGGVEVSLPGNTFDLHFGKWSPHIVVRFSTGLMGKISAVTKMVAIETGGFPSLFVLPMQIYPKETKLPLTSPITFGGELWDKIGPYLTLGMPEDTNGLKDELISEDIFLNLCDEVFAERERMMNTILGTFDEGIFACVFDTLDRIQHMFWKDKDKSLKDKEPTKVVTEWYRRMDEMVGKVLNRIGNNIPLLILSDHGFVSLNTYVHLNNWLVKNGFMMLKNGKKRSGPLFEDVEWTKTYAYALGFNSVYLNLKGREGKGIVDPERAKTLCNELKEKLMRWTENEIPVVKNVYKSSEIYTNIPNNTAPDLIIGYNKGYRASKQTVLGEVPGGGLIEDNHEHWNGDHCCDPSLVPGVLFWSNLDKVGINLSEQISVEDISSLIEEWMNIIYR
jgi:predicted AlkP superfamily phosphohydrolase/phosphomutase